MSKVSMETRSKLVEHEVKIIKERFQDEMCSLYTLKVKMTREMLIKVSSAMSIMQGFKDVREEGHFASCMMYVVAKISDLNLEDKDDEFEATLLARVFLGLSVKKGSPLDFQKVIGDLMRRLEN